jgi:hypothetical protein
MRTVPSAKLILRMSPLASVVLDQNLAAARRLDTPRAVQRHPGLVSGGILGAPRNRRVIKQYQHGALPSDAPKRSGTAGPNPVAT